MSTDRMIRYEAWYLCVNCAGTGATEIDGSDEMCKSCDGWGRVPGPNPPRPDWNEAPAWANWWAVDAGGTYRWFQRKPILKGAYWSPDVAQSGAWSQTLGPINIRIGIDWRTLIEKKKVLA